MFKSVSLFSGCGGLDWGFRQEGFEFVYSCDNDPSACQVHSQNFGNSAHCVDVTATEFQSALQGVGQCDILLGGFPCQGFSKAGPKRQDDPRNALYCSMLDAARMLAPKVIVGENVDGIHQNFKGQVLGQIQRDFASLGYRVHTKILDAAWYGVPQHRRRVFLIMTRADLLGEDFVFPQPTHQVATRNGDFKLCDTADLFSGSPADARLRDIASIRDAIGDLRSLDTGIPDHKIVSKWPDGYDHIFRKIGPGQKLCNVRHAQSSVKTWDIPEFFGAVDNDDVKILETISRNRRRKLYGDIPNGNPLPVDEISRLSGVSCVMRRVEKLEKSGYLRKKGQAYDLKGAMFCSGLFKRPGWNAPSPTVLTNFHNPRYFLHPLENRPFSVRECARLQGFPDDFLFGAGSSLSIIDAYRLIGNAVSPVVSALLAKRVKEFLSRNK